MTKLDRNVANTASQQALEQQRLVEQQQQLEQQQQHVVNNQQEVINNSLQPTAADLGAFMHQQMFMGI